MTRWNCLLQRRLTKDRKRHRKLNENVFLNTKLTLLAQATCRIFHPHKSWIAFGYMVASPEGLF